MTTYTSSLRMTNQDEGSNPNTWGIIADYNFEKLDDAIAGQVNVNITGGGSYTLTTNNGTPDEASHAAIYVFGIPSSANSIIIPATEKAYIVRAAHTSITGGITIRTNSGTGVTFLTGDKKQIYCDGVSVYQIGLTSALDPSENLADLENVSAARGNLGLGPIATYQVSTLLSTVFNAMWPIGSLYSNRTDNTNPGTLMGFGVWASAGLGRVTIGVGTGVDVNGVSVVISAQACGGEYLHTMTTAEMVIHRHDIHPTGGRNGSGIPSGGAIWSGSDTGNYTGTLSARSDYTGSSSAFNVQQPWYSVYQWVRQS